MVVMRTPAYLPECEHDFIACFAPVPVRATGRWTAERQRAFVMALSRGSSVAAAARSVGLAPGGAYALRRRWPESDGFAVAWDDAIEYALIHARDMKLAHAARLDRPSRWAGNRGAGPRIDAADKLMLAALRDLGREIEGSDPRRVRIERARDRRAFDREHGPVDRHAARRAAYYQRRYCTPEAHERIIAEAKTRIAAREAKRRALPGWGPTVRLL